MNNYRLKYFFVSIFLIVSMCSWAQVRYQNARHAFKSNSMSNAYQDSLKNFGDSLYRPDVKAVSPLTKQDMAFLFLPLTFYKNITHYAFVIDETLSPIDAQLLSIYLRRPDMVKSTQSELERVGPTLAPTTVTKDPTVSVQQPSAKEPETLPVDVVVLKPNFWTLAGDYYLQFFQNYISSNWYKGGESNYSMESALTLEANYNNKQRFKWDNKLELKLGFQTSKSDSLHKLRTSNDLLRYTSKLGLQATRGWYYTLQLIANTQFMRNYKSNQRQVLSDFASPLNVNVSFGMDYTVNWFKGKLKGSAHLAPLAYNLKYVDRLALGGRYGLKEGKRTLHDFGSQFTVDLKWRFSDNITWLTRLYGYTTYKRAELEWENTFTFQFNKYISSKLFVYPRFDDGRKRDDMYGYWQLKEYISLGFSYDF
jgi:hypothetical protein